MTREEIERKIDELLRRYVETQDPKVKAELEQLSERLFELASPAFNYDQTVLLDPPGREPFVLPHLSHYEGLMNLKDKEVVWVQLADRDRKRFLLRISYEMASQILAALEGTWPLVERLPPVTTPDTSGPGPFELPHLEKFLGPISVQDDQIVIGFEIPPIRLLLVPISLRAYKLLRDSLIITLTYK